MNERSGSELIKATRAFASEDLATTWRLFGFTVAVAACCAALAGWTTLGWFRIVPATFLGFVNVRLFIFYHDALHGAIFRRSKLGKWVMRVYGLLILTPERVWKDSHNYHHAHTAKIVGASIGSYPVLTLRMYKLATPMQRLQYRVARHWLTMMLGHLTMFFLGMCVRPLMQNPRRNWTAALSILVHVGLIAGLVLAFGWVTAILVFVYPLALSFAVGSYLFFAQHNGPEIEIKDRRDWEFSQAALHSSTMMEVGPLMRWLTGDIGYHHVHHLNSMIPFYRLEEAMDAIPELQSPRMTTLAPKEILRCLNTSVWDPHQGRMLTYRELRREMAGTQPTAQAA